MKNEDKKLIICDLDGTLTVSKSPIGADIATIIVKLLETKKVAVISGGGYPQFQTQFLSRLPGNVDNLSNLYLLPTSGTRLYVWKGNWSQTYAEDLTTQEKEQILTAMDMALKAAEYEKPQNIFGPIIEDRGSQITFSALGQSAPAEIKYAWDPTRKKREKIKELLERKIPGFDVRIGGATSVDVTRRGINKAYGIRKLEQYLNIESDAIVFIGDALFYGGNDYPARASGVDCIEVRGPEDTLKILQGFIT
ncbi:MAG: HAD-IIB family hydrolase [Candidatus Paceibacterota bacterium]|jgi:hypothetical protein